MMAVGIGLLGLIALVFLLGAPWRTCLKVVLCLVVIDGAIRKWVFPQGQIFIFFAKDFVILIAYLKYWMAMKGEARQGLPAPVRVLMWMSFAYCLIELGNPNLGSPIVGIMGLSRFFIYVPMMFLVRDCFESTEELIVFLRRYCLWVIPVCLLAAIQYGSPPDAWINKYASDEQVKTIATVGNAVRVTSTFAYIVGYCVFVQMIALFSLPLFMISQPWPWPILTKIFLGAAVICSLMSGSRGAVFGILVILILYICFSRSFWRYKIYRRFIIPLILGFFITTYYAQDALNNFIDRVQNSDNLGGRAAGSFLINPDTFAKSGIFGYGIGATYQGTAILRSKLNLSSGVYLPFTEDELDKIVVELGQIGFFIWYGFRAFLIYYLWRVSKYAKHPFLKELGIASFVLHFFTLPGQTVYNVTYLVYYWFIAGFIMLIPRLDNLPEKQQLSQ